MTAWENTSAFGRLSLFALAVTTLPLTAAAADKAPPSRRARATGISRPIRVDGVLDEAAWQTAAWNSGFVRIERHLDNPGAEVQTRFKVVHTPSAVYVAVECDEPRIERLKAKTPWRDGAVWADDCVELFFDPGGSGRYYHQIMVNSKGRIYDSYAADFGLVKSRLWNGAYRAAGHVDRKGRKWSVEVEIPFGTLVLGEKAGARWRWNVARERHAGGTLELSSWVPLKGSFHQPLEFGTIVGMPDDYTAFRLTVGEAKVTVSRTAGGTASLTTRVPITNGTGRDLRIVATAELADHPGSAVTAPPRSMEVGGQADVAFPPLTLKGGSVPEAAVVFTFAEQGTGRILKKLLRGLSTQDRPLALTVLRPVYRSNIYASERVPEIEFTLSVSPEVGLAATRFHLALRDEQGGVLSERTVSPAAATAGTLRLGTAGMKVGAYTLAVQALDAAGKELAAVLETIRKLPPPDRGHEIRIDENRNLLVDGVPFFGIGWYGRVPTEDPRAEVVALQNVTVPVVVPYPDVSGIRKSYREHGIYSIVSLEHGRFLHSFKIWQKQNAHLKPALQELHTLEEPSETLKELARKMVEAVRGEPGVLGYYIADEPEIHDIPSKYLENYYRYLRELDPYHPVFITNDTIDGLVTHGYTCADVLSPDPYSPELDYVPNFLKKINEIRKPGQTTYVTLWHATSQTHFTRPIGSAPPYSYRTFRNQYFASIVYGAKGFTAYTADFFLPETEYRYGLPAVWRELRVLAPALAAPPPTVPVSLRGGEDLAVWGRIAGGYVYLVVVNHKTGPRRSEISWQPLGEREHTVMSEGRTVRARAGKLTAELASGDVRVFTDDPKARTLPSSAAVERELAVRKAATAKPGNLLHMSRGTRVGCSKGYFAPWFHQYFYYAINGITDDRGWSAYAWDGTSAWAEFTLAEPAAIGQVILYTPNIRDYRLDVTGPDGARRSLRVQGNTRSLVRHGFEPPLRALKLRLTVTAVNPAGGKYPILAEIEAYAERRDAPVAALDPLEEATPVPAARTLFAEALPQSFLWQEDFTDFQTAPKYYWDGRDTKWVLDADHFGVRPRSGGGIVYRSRSPRGYSGMTHFFPYDPGYRFFQVKLSRIEGKGYRFTNIRLGDSSGKPGFRGCINTARPGIYTVDAHCVHESFRNAKRKQAFVNVGSAGAAKKPDGTVSPGPQFTLDWIRLARRPVNGLAVTRPDGSPLGSVLRKGDTIHLEVHLEAPARDVTVGALIDSNYRPFPLNGQPYVQLAPANPARTVWSADLAIGPETGTFAPKGYPLVFEAVITAGSIDKTYASAFVAFE